MPDVVLCELEGVLVDTAMFRRRALRASLATEHLAPDDRALAEHCAGRSVRESVVAALAHAGRALDETGMQLLIARAEREFLAHAGTGLALTVGAREFLDALAGQARVALVTRANRRAADLMLTMVGAADAFEVVITADDAPEPKPDAAPFRAALSRLQRHRAVHPERVVALEDGLDGVRAAHAAMIHSVAVGTVPAHVAAEANAHIASLVGHDAASLDVLLASHEVSPR